MTRMFGGRPDALGCLRLRDLNARRRAERGGGRKRGAAKQHIAAIECVSF